MATFLELPILSFAMKLSGFFQSPRSIFGFKAPDRKNEISVLSTGELHPTIQELKSLIEGDAEMYLLLNKAFEQVPESYTQDPVGKPQARDHLSLLTLLNGALTSAPEYLGPASLLTGLPFGSTVNWLMGTAAGSAFFLNQKVTKQFDRILIAWGVFLKTEASLLVINDSPKGWLCDTALNMMVASSKNDPQVIRFEDEFVCKPDQPHYGFRSWDDFFTREFRSGRRPVADPEDRSVVINSCEAAPYRLAKNVRELDCFWLKEQPYSLRHMLADDDDFVAHFIGGTVLQSFLFPESYHRWHSPVDGTVTKVLSIPGTSFSKVQTGEFDGTDPMESQAYITQVSTRALLYIQADDARIGLMCVMPVGMGECSCCEITVAPGERISKGDQLGMFHFGGSTMCLIFRQGVNLDFDFRGQNPNPAAKVIPVNSKIATIRDPL
ncbi:hypothetical protein MMC10_003147 [Thelotrema lepadinum]|nr:hypothetical protein [Thelotrema lepadinum]